MPFNANDARPDVIEKPLVFRKKLRALKLGAGNDAIALAEFYEA